MKTVVLQIKQDLVNYLQKAFAKHMHDGVLCLPVQSPFYRFVSEKLYGHCHRTLVRPQGNLTLGFVSLGNSKNSAWYYQLGKEATRELERMIDYRMRKDLYERMKEGRRKYGVTYVETVNRFMQEYDIRGVTEDAFLRGYRRKKAQNRLG